MLRLAIICLIASIAGFASGRVGAQDIAQGPADPSGATLKRVIAAFDATVFGPAEFRRDRLLRLDGPARIEVFGDLTAAHWAILTDLVDDLAGLTGLDVALDIGLVDERGEAVPVTRRADGRRAFQIHVVPGGGFDMLLYRQSWVSNGTMNALADQMCAFATFGLDTIDGGLILIDGDLPPATVGHCLVEELAQAFGPIADTDLLDTSAFNDLGALVDRLQPDDRLILAALYDRRLFPGMDRATALARLPAIVFDLLVRAEN